MSNAESHRPEDDAFLQLKSLLLTEDQDRIQELEAKIIELKTQLAQKDQLIQTLEPVVVEVLKRKIIESKTEVVEAISPIMSESIKAQIANAKDDMVDALYPLLGAMVKKSVTESIKHLVEQVNRMMENAFSWEMLKAKLKAKFTGVSPGELLLADASPFQLEGIYLIAKGSGILIAYALREDRPELQENSQLIGGMLTAIKSFVETAFSGSGQDDLRDVNLDDHKIRIQNGRYSYIAVVYTGYPNREFDDMLRECHDIIHKNFHQQLRNYDGNNEALSGIETPLLDIIRKMQTIENE